MILKVNGTQIDITLENEKTVGEVLKSFEAEAARNEATTVNIRLNGKDISADAFDEAIKEPVQDDTLLELTVITKNDIRDSFRQNAEAFALISEKLPDVSVQLQSSKEKEATAVIKELAEEIDSFCHTATLSALFPELYEALKIDGMDAGNFFNELSPLLADLEKALEGGDSVTVGDLSEYEISPRLKKLSEAIKNSVN